MKATRAYKIISGVVIGIIAVYFAINLFFDPVLERMVYKRLDSYINNTPNRLYDITYRNFQISIHNRAVRLGRINITPRKNAIDSMKNNKLSMLISFEADSFYFEGLSIFKLLVLNEIKLQEVVSKNPTVKLYLNSKAKVAPHKSGLINSAISDKLQSGYVHKFNIEDGNFFIIKFSLKDSIYFRLNSSFLMVDDILIEPSEKEFINRVKFKDLQFSSGLLFGKFIDHYDINADSIELNSKSRKLQINNFTLQPKNFVLTSKAVQFARDVISVKSDKIVFEGIDIRNNEIVHGFNSEKLDITGLDFALSTDKRVQKNMDRKPLIGELIRSINTPFNINEIEISDSKISYREIVDTDTKPLAVFFTNVNLKSTRVTNDKTLLKTNPGLKINCSAKFLDVGDCNLNIDVPFNSDEDKMIVSGKLNSMTMQPANKMLEGPLQVRFLSGKINSVDIDFVADTKRAKGTLLFDYSNLKIQGFKEKEKKSKEIKERNKWFINALINGAVKKDNNKDSEKFVTGIIKYERPQDIGIPGYMFRSVKSGLISTFKPGTRRKAINKDKKEVREQKKETQKPDSKKNK